MAAPTFTRYAVYYTPSGALAEHGAAWLGWDIARGVLATFPIIDSLDVASITQRPRKYGFHATLKPPFVLSDGHTETQLRASFDTLCQTLCPVTFDGLSVVAMGRFLALVPQGRQDDLMEMAATILRDLDMFRAPASSDELAQRRKRKLTALQESNLMAWGYPFVMDAFRFHITLTERMRNAQDIAPLVESYFEPVLPAPFQIDALTLVGERSDGTFVEIERRPLTR